MIAYDLQCQSGHCFECWFKDSAAYTEQQQAGLIACPVCNDTRVHRIPSTFAIKGSSPAPPPSNKGEGIDPRVLAQAIHQYVEQNFDNVGTEFAREALKIHYGVSEPRNIRGVSTASEEDTLRREGIEFFKWPMPSSDPAGSNDDPSSSEPDA